MFHPIKTLAILGAVLLSLFAMAVYAAVGLNYFQGQWNGHQITLYWETGTELDHAAFHVWRSTENLPTDSGGIDRSRAERLTEAFLLNSDQNPCTSQGYTYEYIDETVDNYQQVYYYYLESFNCSDGTSEFQGNLNTIDGLEIQNSGTPAVTATRRATVTPSTTRTPYRSARLYLPLIMRLTPTDYYSFEASQRFYLPNCNLTQVKGVIWDGESNSRLNGVTVRVWYDGAAFHEFYSPTSGSPPRKPGEWEITLATYPKAGKWYVQVVDRETGEALSPKQTVYTDTRWCESGQSGHQVVIQDFIKHSEGSGVPVPPPPTNVPTPFSYP